MVQTNDNSDLYVDLNLEPMPEPFHLAWTDLALSTRDLPPTSWLVPGLVTVGESTLHRRAEGWQDNLPFGAPKGGNVMGRVWLLSESSFWT